jgi:ABC-type nickel/cobalt efflux system permease component RcnA
MLVALGDAALLLISAGLPVLIALLSVVAITVGAVAARRMSRRDALVRQDTAVMVPAMTRRRA